MSDYQLVTGDCRPALAAMRAESVHCVVTSPPYYGLRDYGVDGQLGLERTPEAYVANMVEVFRAVRRVLRKDGTLWLNLGDSYANDGKWGGSSGGKHVAALHGNTGIGRQKVTTGLKPKDLVGMPWRVAFALQADGWYLRSDIIWSKPNPMPESVTDRPTKAHEYLFLLTRSERYFYDAEAIKERASVPVERFVPACGANNMDPSALRNDKVRHGGGQLGMPGTRNRRSVWHIATQPFPGCHFAVMPPALVEPCILAGTSERGCCAECGAPWERVVEVDYRWHEKWHGEYHNGAGRNDRGKAGVGYNERVGTRTIGWQPSCACYGVPPLPDYPPAPARAAPEQEAHAALCEPIRAERLRLLNGWRALPTVPCTVLDPFAGSGTVGEVAIRLGRSFVGVELNPEYAEMARRRIADAPFSLFAGGA